MDTHTLIQQQDFIMLPGEPSDAAALDVRLNGADVVRSEENILQWVSYLPEDCVRTMIEMGWDITT